MQPTPDFSIGSATPPVRRSNSKSVSRDEAIAVFGSECVKDEGERKALLQEYRLKKLEKKKISEKMKLIEKETDQGLNRMVNRYN